VSHAKCKHTVWNIWNSKAANSFGRHKMLYNIKELHIKFANFYISFSWRQRYFVTIKNKHSNNSYRYFQPFCTVIYCILGYYRNLRCVVICINGRQRFSFCSCLIALIAPPKRFVSNEISHRP
jgi:hypothetical protein